MKLNLFTKIALANTLLLSTFTTPAIAELSKRERYPIRDAISLYFTPKGMEFFKTNLESVILKNGFSFRDGYIESFAHTEPQPVNLNQLPEKYKHLQKAVNNIKEVLESYLGMTVKDPQLSITGEEIEWNVEFDRFQVVANLDALKERKKSSGAVFEFGFTARNVYAGAKSLRVWDKNNPFFGQYGIKDLSFEFKDKALPLAISVQIYLDINDKGEPEIEITRIGTNAQKVKIEANYSGLILPKISVKIDDKEFGGREKYIEQKLNEQKPDIVRMIQARFDAFAKEDLPNKLYQTMKGLPRFMENVNYMDAPGSSDAKAPKLTWGLTLSKIRQNENALQFNFDGFADDPTNKKRLAPTAPLNASFLESGSVAPKLPVQNNSYDIALALNENFLNRVLDLAFLRGNFKNIQLDAKTSISLFKPPVVSFRPVKVIAGRQSVARFKMHAAIEQIMSGIKGAIFKKENGKRDMEIEFDMITKLVMLPEQVDANGVKQPAGLAMVLESVDLDSMQINKNKLSWIGRMVDGKVEKEARKTLEETSQKALQADQSGVPMRLASNLPFPPDLAGIKTKVINLSNDQVGRMFLFLEYVK